MEDIRITAAVAKLLQLFVDLAGERTYGYDLIRATGFQSGKLYPILDRLEKAGWLASEFESVEQKGHGRPPRRWYSLKGAAVVPARTELARFHQQQAPAPRRSRRLHPQGGSA